MSQYAVESVLGKMITDPAFRDAFFTSPDATARRVGLKLGAEEIAALLQVHRAALERFALTVDDRICRMSPCVVNAEESLT
jgi:hypothetical protein